MSTDLLFLQRLTLGFRGQAAAVVDDVSLQVKRGEILCLVGESGCGKSVTAMAMMGLLPPDATRISQGNMVFEGQTYDLTRDSLPGQIKGDRIAMIFQEPMSSLNPAFRIGDQIAETVLRHRGGSRTDAMARATQMLDRVGIASPGQRLKEYPHQLSGGMRQRVMIAMALANDPQLLIADEPTTALDVTIQAQILDLIRDLRAEMGMGTIMITHDLGVVAEIADSVAVMYGGQVVEQGPAADLFANPQHPYTIGLMSAMPRLDSPGGRLAIVPGTVPSIANMPQGCRFRTRCPFANAVCIKRPVLDDLGKGHRVACHYAPLETHLAVTA
ncbi:ABC transporter ATP-binding protein [Actibacterium sp. 188UL27-1]|uniref:ABC transporter ATP-binding protein n=1 Tax=Actibacterium sp. 188UL27-1 TaxID=2786961 RepID=UPI00195EFA62|nr:ABC transporter ATP-binding protein [Actibacterium sp. 188UL27-1]MBM7066040.1 ABC transporter ATP-binding protein [Actibacterium sp. 188UL27-1]